jgi:L-fuculose-phosphate aldolase
LTVNDICVLQFTDLVQIAGDRTPSVERKLHARVLRARRDCSASIHTHQPIASAYTLLGRDLNITLSEHQAVLGNKSICVGYAPSGTGWLAARLARRLQPDVHAYFLRNHGVLCCGASLAEAMGRVEALEDACRHFFCDAIAAGKAGTIDPWPSTVMKSLLRKESWGSLK